MTSNRTKPSCASGSAIGLSASSARFAQLAVDATDVAELEVNPLVADPDGVVAVDARARLE